MPLADLYQIHFRREFQLLRATRQVDGNCVRNRRRARSRIFLRPEEFWTYSIRRCNPVHFVARSDNLDRLQYMDRQQKDAALLDSNGTGLRDLAVRAGSVDLS